MFLHASAAVARLHPIRYSPHNSIKFFNMRAFCVWWIFLLSHSEKVGRFQAFETVMKRLHDATENEALQHTANIVVEF